jgi:chromodomain-helicase-DNA-binding protein 1
MSLKLPIASIFGSSFSTHFEAHRVKNDQSLLHRAVSSANIDWLLLMTGTPIQNNLPELYALLALVDPNTFPADGAAQFVQKYGTITRDDQGIINEK